MDAANSMSVLTLRVNPTTLKERPRETGGDQKIAERGDRRLHQPCGNVLKTCLALLVHS
ncbi:hypothetical protein [Mesorhizobium sp. NZP2234]|uniref:hypothetical protein n=1 Tax=Mesorhizobium sp. NZP2234 TaxID=2483402 RepID=UPI00138ECB6C|nr:hypothetical protein [Mesorhizobium sp. NZP2234]